MGENTGITSAAPRWLSRTISALEAEDVEVNMTKLDAMEQVCRSHAAFITSSPALMRSLLRGQEHRRGFDGRCDGQSGSDCTTADPGWGPHASVVARVSSHV